MPKTLRKPSYTLHKASGRVRVNGRDRYFSGPFGSPESLSEYDEFCREWFATQDVTSCRLAVDDLVILYVDHADAFYRKNGKPTGEIHGIRVATRFLVEFCGRTRARDFGPRQLRLFRDSLIGRRDARLRDDSPEAECRTLSRQYINKLIGKVVRMFKWAAAEELVDESRHTALTKLEPLKRGRSGLREARKVQPVDDAHVDAILPHVPPTLRAMIGLQRYTGMRPGEVVELRPCDITIGTDGLWSYRPARFKTEHHDDAERVVFIGPRGQDVLRPFLERDPDAYCFSPREAMEWRNAQRRTKRRSKVQPPRLDRRKPAPRKQPGEKYTTATYRRAIRSACFAQKIPAWTPNMIRHTVGTIVRQRFGLEASQCTLGHRHAAVTQVYAQRNQRLAADVAKAIG